jgi:hypothetical protein
MATPSYRRRFTGELAIEPALHQLVMASATMMDRLLCTGQALAVAEAPAPWPPDPEGRPPSRMPSKS